MVHDQPFTTVKRRRLRTIKQFRTTPNVRGKRRGSGKPDSSICHFDGIPKTVKMTCLQWRFATEPLPL